MSAPDRPASVTAQQAATLRLTHSRAALAQELMRGVAPTSGRPDARQQQGGELSLPPRAPGTRQPQTTTARSAAWLRQLAGPLLSQTIRLWWQQQPVYVASQMARPVLAQVARQRPFLLLGSAAAIGAVLVLLKPWRRWPGVALIGLSVRPPSVNTLTQWLQNLAASQTRAGRVN